MTRYTGEIRTTLSDRQRRILLAALVATGNATQADGSAQWEPLSDRCVAVERAVIALDEARTGEERLLAMTVLAARLAGTVDMPAETAECVHALLHVTPSEVPA